jgi:hypothetical protein
MFDSVYGSNLAFGTSNNYASGITNTAMLINYAGNVGIGTTDPQGILQARAGTDQNFLVRGPINLADGISLYSVNDANSVLKEMELTASSFALMGGNVGIGTTTPGARLDVRTTGQPGIYGESDAGGIAVYGYNSGTNYGLRGYSAGNYAIQGQTGTSSYGGILGYNYNGGTYGILGYGTGYTLYGNGIALASGGFTTSDRRLKRDITTIEPTEALEKILRMRPVSFTWDERSEQWAANQGINYSFIAQEMQTILPGVVMETTAPPSLQGTEPSLNQELGSTLSISQTALIPYAVGAIQELYQEVTQRIDYAGAPTSTPTLRIDENGNVGIGITTPSAQLHTTGPVRFENFGAGTLVTDADGNVSVSSDERLKDVTGMFASGLAAVLAIDPIQYRWNEDSGFDKTTIYAGFSSQNVREAIPEAVGMDKRGFLTLSDRPILASTINAIKEVWQKLEEYMTRTERLEERVAELEAQIAIGTEDPNDNRPAEEQADESAGVPTLTLVGANPAEIAVSADYSDLGVIAKDEDGNDLTVTYTLNGVAVPRIEIDTTADATFTIGYAATDGNEQTTTIERTVIVGTGETATAADTEESTQTNEIQTQPEENSTATTTEQTQEQTPEEDTTQETSEDDTQKPEATPKSTQEETTTEPGDSTTSTSTETTT